MKFNKLIAMGLAMVFSLSGVATAYANDDDLFWDWYFAMDDEYEYDYSTTPVITSPSEYDTILTSDQVKINWKYTGNKACTVSVQDETGNISYINPESGNKATIMPNKLARGKSYIITVKAGNVTSDPVTITIANREQEMVEIVYRTEVERAEPRIDGDLIVPEGSFDTKEHADLNVKTVNVKVWQIGYGGKKITKTIPITVNARLADTVVKIFDEIYNNQLQFPIKSASGYTYRTTASNSRLSEHAYGTAIDINPNENYCVYSNGTTVGSYYKPYEDPYSVVPEIINIFRKYNFGWGGSFEDYMHFSYFGS